MSLLFEGAPTPKTRRRKRPTAPLLPGILQFGGCASPEVIALRRDPDAGWSAKFPRTLGFATGHGPDVPADEVAAAVAADWPSYRVEVSR